MSNAPIRQHWIPRSYLRAFCAKPASEEQIYTRDLDSGREFRASLSNIALIRNFYTLELNTDSPSYAIEEALASIESNFAPLLNRIIETKELILTDSERYSFAHFLAVLHMRTRQGLAMIQSYRDEVASLLGTANLNIPEAKAEQLIKLDNNGLREFFARAILSLAPRLANALLPLNWRLLHASDNHFITSENPLVVYHPTAHEWGIGTPGTLIQLPITPSLLLHISTEPLIPGIGTFNLPAVGVSALNGITLAAAEQYIFSSQPFDGIRSLIEDRPIGKRREFGPKSLVQRRGRT